MSHCERCGCYEPMRLDESGRVSCGCDRTTPSDGLPVTIYVCPTCGGHGAFAWGCWGTKERPHEHCYMVAVHKLVRELQELKRGLAR